MGFYVIKKRKTLQTCVTEQLTPQSQLCARDLLWLETVHVPGEQFVRLCLAATPLQAPPPDAIISLR